MVNKHCSIPIITIDGTAGSGKGTISAKLAKHLGWHLLDSGMLYRAVALSYMWYLDEKRSAKVKANNISINQQDLINGSKTLDLLASDNLDLATVGPKNLELLASDNLDLATVEPIVASLAANLQLIFAAEDIYVRDQQHNLQKVTKELRSEGCGKLASKLAALPMARAALLTKQHEFLRAPGLVADGRDMGTVVFKQAKLKVFLDADPQVRAARRDAQLKDFGVDGKLYNRVEELCERDLRDKQREVAPLKPAKDALCINTTTMTIDEVFNVIMNQVNSTILR